MKYKAETVAKIQAARKDPSAKVPQWFKDLFEKHAHPDDWGVPCTYDYAAWRIYKAAIRRQQRAHQVGTSHAD